MGKISTFALSSCGAFFTCPSFTCCPRVALGAACVCWVWIPPLKHEVPR